MPCSGAAPCARTRPNRQIRHMLKLCPVVLVTSLGEPCSRLAAVKATHSVFGKLCPRTFVEALSWRLSSFGRCCNSSFVLSTIVSPRSGFREKPSEGRPSENGVSWSTSRSATENKFRRAVMLDEDSSRTSFTKSFWIFAIAKHFRIVAVVVLKKMYYNFTVTGDACTRRFF